MKSLFKRGDKISGCCSGQFGKDDYDEKTCVLVTDNYALFEFENGNAIVLNYESNFENTYVDDLIEDWNLVRDL